MFMAIFLIAAVMALGITVVVLFMEAREKLPGRLLLVGAGVLCMGGLIAMTVVDHMIPEKSDLAWLMSPGKAD